MYHSFSFSRPVLPSCLYLPLTVTVGVSRTSIFVDSEEISGSVPDNSRVSVARISKTQGYESELNLKRTFVTNINR